MNRNLYDPKQITRQQLADRLGTTYERVCGMERRGCPHVVINEGNGKKNRAVRFDIIEVLAWLRAFEAEKKELAAVRRAEQRL